VALLSTSLQNSRFRHLQPLLHRTLSPLIMIDAGTFQGHRLPETSANSGATDRIDKETATQPTDGVAGAKLFIIIFVTLAIGVQAIWVAFLIWLAIRAVF
jgi:hypothetical protein